MLASIKPLKSARRHYFPDRHLHVDGSKPGSHPKRELNNIFELIPDTLAVSCGELDEIEFQCSNSQNQIKQNFIRADYQSRFISFSSDYGPVNLAVVYRFCAFISSKLDQLDAKLVYCIEEKPEIISNAAFLLGAFLMLHRGASPAEAAHSFDSSGLPTIHFRDTGHGPAVHHISLAESLSGLARAASLGCYDPRSFRLSNYEELLLS